MTKPAASESHVPESWSPDGKYISSPRQTRWLWVVGTFRRRQEGDQTWGYRIAVGVGIIVLARRSLDRIFTAGEHGAVSRNEQTDERGGATGDQTTQRRRTSVIRRRRIHSAVSADRRPVSGSQASDRLPPRLVARRQIAVLHTVRQFRPLGCHRDTAHGDIRHGESLPARALTGDRIAAEGRAWDILPDGGAWASCRGRAPSGLTRLARTHRFDSCSTGRRTEAARADEITDDTSGRRHDCTSEIVSTFGPCGTGVPWLRRQVTENAINDEPEVLK